MSPAIVALESAVGAGVLPPGGLLMVACSGGIDSMGLLHAARALDRWTLRVATVDHGLREGSAEDAAFVVEVARAWGVAAEILTADPARVREGAGPEDAARAERYRLLEGHAARWHAERLVTAHTADDQAETLLMRVALGAGTRGLAGIPPLRGRIARPWLDVPRAAVRDYAEANAVPWRDDPTNATARFLRNRLRRGVTAEMGALFGPAWSRVASRTAAHVRGDVEALDYLLARLRADVVQSVEDGVVLRAAALEDMPPGLRDLVLRDAIEAAAQRASAPPVRDLTAHVAQIAGLLSTGGGTRSLDLPGGLEARCSYDRLRIGRRAATRRGRRAGVLGPLTVRGPGEFVWGRWVLRVESVAGLPPDGERGDGCLGRGGAPLPWVIRLARPGERMRPLGAPGSKRVARLWQDARVPSDERGGLPVIESAERVVWAPGLRVAHEARVRLDEPAFRVSLRTVEAVDGPDSSAEERNRARG